MRRPLICTQDDRLLDELLRLAAAAGVEAEVAVEPATARRCWSRAPLVLVGADGADGLAAAALPRRSGVVLVSLDLDDASVWRRAVGVGADRVVMLPDGEAWLVDALADAGEGEHGRGSVVCVVGGRGGAGASTLAVALGVTALHRGMPTMVVDADPLGGGIDLLFGGEDAAGLRWPDLAETRGRVRAAALAEALPRMNDLTVLSWDRRSRLAIPPESMATLLSAARRTNDVVVVDLPRSFDDAARVALAAATTCLVLVPAEVRACASAQRVVAAALDATDDVRVVVRGPSPSGLRPRTCAELLGVPLAGSFRAERFLVDSLEWGDPPGRRARGSLHRFCAEFLDTRSMSRRSGPAAA
jgi:secretion/DNA translocation related CpaE-like protein